MSIYDRDFSKIVPAAFLDGSIVQAVNVLEAAVQEIAILKKEYDALLTTWADIKARRDACSRENDLLRSALADAQHRLKGAGMLGSDEVRAADLTEEARKADLLPVPGRKSK